MSKKGAQHWTEHATLEGIHTFFLMILGILLPMLSDWDLSIWTSTIRLQKKVVESFPISQLSFLFI